MRRQLTDLLARFRGGAIDALELRAQLKALLKQGVAASLSPDEATAVNELLEWYLDLYNPTLKPRPGVLGRLKDFYAEIIHHEYHVSEGGMRRKVEELDQLLSASRLELLAMANPIKSFAGWLPARQKL